MFLFAHMGIGWKLAKPLAGASEQRGLPMRWVLAGTLLPDLIDKPLYYLNSWLTGLQGESLGLLSGTRTFGHTALLLLLLLAFSSLRGSRAVAALALGMSTHILLDQLGDSLFVVMAGGKMSFDWSSPKLTGLLWPFLGNRFPIMPYEGIGGHAHSLLMPHILLGEMIGALILWREWRRRPSRHAKIS